MNDDLTILIPCKGEDCERVPVYPPYTIHVIRDRQYGEAILQGIQKAKTTYLATMDADGQHTLRDVLRLWKVLQAEDADMVIGHRPRVGSGVRPLASCALNLAASIVAGRRVPDLGCGARVFRRDMALELAPRLPEGFDFNAVLTTLALVRGYQVRWVPIPHRPRQRGESHVRMSDGVRTLKSLQQIALQR